MSVHLFLSLRENIHGPRVGDFAIDAFCVESILFDWKVSVVQETLDALRET